MSDPTVEDLVQLREWLGKIPYMPHDLKDHEIAAFYRGGKGSLERTKERIDSYFQARLKFPEMMKFSVDLLSPEVQQQLDSWIVTPLPKTTADDCVVVMVKLKEFDPDQFGFTEFCRLMNYVAATMLQEDTCRSGKVIFIIDAKGLTTRHLVKLYPHQLASALSIVTSAVPVRMKGVHVLNIPTGADWILSFAKAILKTKLIQRIHFHGRDVNLTEWIPKQVLPLDYGGEQESLHKIYGVFRKKMESYSLTFLELEKKWQQLDMLRKESNNTLLVGSFRKLEVD